MSFLSKIGLGGGGGVSFDTHKDIPDLTGQVALVTGGNGGIGAETVKALAAYNCTVYLASRTPKTAESTVSSIKAQSPNADIRLIDIDLGDFKSVKAAAEKLSTQTQHIDIIVCNAGISLTNATLSASGYELQFATNYLGHALLIHQLMPLLQRSVSKGIEPRIVLVSSEAHTDIMSKGSLDLSTAKTTQSQHSSIRRYGMSKLAMNLFTKEMSRRYTQICTVAIHPGAVSTNVFRTFEENHPYIAAALKPVASMTLKTPEDGAKNQIWAATAKTGVVSGEYYNPIGKTGGASRATYDLEKQRELWEWTEAQFREEFGAWPQA